MNNQFLHTDIDKNLILKMYFICVESGSNIEFGNCMDAVEGSSHSVSFIVYNI